MTSKICGCLAILVCLVLASTGRAGDVTIDGKVKVTKLMGTYEIEFSGELTLKDTGGGFEQWASITCEISQGGKKGISAGISSLTPPTLTAKGSYVAKVQVSSNADPNWTATSIITWYRDKNMTTDAREAKQAFIAP